MKRIHCLLSDVDSTRDTVQDLMAMHIDDQRIHLFAAEDVSFDCLSEDSLLHNSGYVPALQKGLGAGGTIGILAGLLAATYPPAGLTLAGGALLSLKVATHEPHDWFGYLSGLAVAAGKMDSIERAVRNGGFLVGVDLMADTYADIVRLLSKNGITIPSQSRGNMLSWGNDPVAGKPAPVVRKTLDRAFSAPKRKDTKISYC